MKSLVTVFLFGFFGLIIAQEYNFKPNWKKGDAKEIKITEVVKSYENDKLASTEESKRSVFLKVLKNKKNDITVEFELENGSLLLMKGETQSHWLHKLPTTKKVAEPRVNLTFRWIK